MSELHRVYALRLAAVALVLATSSHAEAAVALVAWDMSADPASNSSAGRRGHAHETGPTSALSQSGNSTRGDRGPAGAIGTANVGRRKAGNWMNGSGDLGSATDPRFGEHFENPIDAIPPSSDPVDLFPSVDEIEAPSHVFDQTSADDLVNSVTDQMPPLFLPTNPFPTVPSEIGDIQVTDGEILDPSNSPGAPWDDTSYSNYKPPQPDDGGYVGRSDTPGSSEYGDTPEYFIDDQHNAATAPEASALFVWTALITIVFACRRWRNHF